MRQFYSYRMNGICIATAGDAANSFISIWHLILSRVVSNASKRGRKMLHIFIYPVNDGGDGGLLMMFILLNARCDWRANENPI